MSVCGSEVGAQFPVIMCFVVSALVKRIGFNTVVGIQTVVDLYKRSCHELNMHIYGWDFQRIWFLFSFARGLHNFSSCFQDLKPVVCHMCTAMASMTLI